MNVKVGTRNLQNEPQRKRLKSQRAPDASGTIQEPKSSHVGRSTREKRETKGKAEKIFEEITVKHFLNLMKSTPKHIIRKKISK